MRLPDAEKLCRDLMAEHGLAHWNFTWINSRVCFGRCHYGIRAIMLSIPLVEANGVDQVRDTILHEMAHALAGLKAKHGPLWVMVAKRIGCKGTRCFTWDEVNKPEYPKIGGYIGACYCGLRQHFRAMKPKDGRVYFCNKCHRRIDFSKQ